jgi:hypothetical protein
MAKDKTLEVDAAEIRIRAGRRLGEMLAAQKAAGGFSTGVRLAGAQPGANDGSSAVVADDHRPDAPKLAAAGISKDLSSRAQKLAAVPEAEFEAEVGEWRERVNAEGAERAQRLLTQAGRSALLFLRLAGHQPGRDPQGLLALLGRQRRQRFAKSGRLLRRVA